LVENGYPSLYGNRFKPLETKNYIVIK